MNQELVRAVNRLGRHRNFLQRCQVDTPTDVVNGVWTLVREYRKQIGTVFDPGAGDGRFALHGSYRSYVGYEIDKNRPTVSALPHNAKIISDCAFTADSLFDVCIGNPPYVRHHDIDPIWRDTVASIIESKSDRTINRQANAFTYFMWQAILATEVNGLIAMLVPYEWVSRPSTRSLREYISENRWAVDVYRFSEDIFPRVMTTASITVIDKSSTCKKWSYFLIDKTFASKRMHGPCGTGQPMLGYERRRSEIFAKRGLSPGSQKVFLLTEGDRIHHGLKVGRDVLAAVGTLRHLPKSLTVLNRTAFVKHFVDAGIRCWIIQSTDKPSSRLKGYLDGVELKKRDTWTCRQRARWWEYGMVEVPKAIFGAGFRKFGPRILENHIAAIPVGGVCGLHFRSTEPFRRVLSDLRSINFEAKVVHHSNSLKKVEIGQMNKVLREITSAS